MSSPITRRTTACSPINGGDLQTGVDRLLSQALNALAGVALDVSDAGDNTGVGEPDSESSAGVA